MARDQAPTQPTALSTDAAPQNKELSASKCQRGRGRKTQVQKVGELYEFQSRPFLL